MNLSLLVLSRIFLPLWLAQFAAGSFAEIVQALVLYPLDTIKVNCQHTGMSSFQMCRSLLKTYSGVNLLLYLYNGAGTMALASVFIGSAYYVSYKQSSLFFARIFPAKTTPPTPPPLDSNSTPLIVERAGGSTVADSTSPADKASTSAIDEKAVVGDMRADICAAALASVCAGIIEGPIECVRNRIQAGVVQQNMMQYILKGGGIAAAWPFFVPHLLKTLPYDIAELVTYSTVRKHADAHKWNGFTEEMKDAVMGGFAGAVAVLASAPADCIKTRIVTMSPLIKESLGQPSSTGQMWRAASRHILRTQGIAGMFVGTVPRLIEKVPSTMMYWVAIEACARYLKRLTKEGHLESLKAAATV